jgi:sec-independent protein translocase protein TatB
MFPENRFLELLIIGALALIVVGPKDLPILMRRVGQFVGKMRGMAAEFRASFDELARQSELDELRREVEALRTGHQDVMGSINPLSHSHTSGVFGDINQSLSPQMTPLPASQPVAEAPAAPEPILPEPVVTEAAKAPAKPRAPRKAPAKAAAPIEPAVPAKPRTRAKAKAPPADGDVSGNAS